MKKIKNIEKLQKYLKKVNKNKNTTICQKATTIANSLKDN